MSFYKSRTGGVIDGSPERSHTGSFRIVADGTRASARIDNIELKTFEDGSHLYQVTWKLLDTDFKGCEVRQKINPFSEKPEKADKELNMMVRLFTLCSFKPSHDKAPTTDDLKPLKGNMLGIVIRQWAMDGKEGNFVSEIHMLDAHFVAETGVLITHVAQSHSTTSGVESALTRNAGSKLAPHDPLIDVPW